MCVCMYIPDFAFLCTVFQHKVVGAINHGKMNGTLVSIVLIWALFLSLCVIHLHFIDRLMLVSDNRITSYGRSIMVLQVLNYIYIIWLTNFNFPRKINDWSFVTAIHHFSCVGYESVVN